MIRKPLTPQAQLKLYIKQQQTKCLKIKNTLKLNNNHHYLNGSVRFYKSLIYSLIISVDRVGVLEIGNTDSESEFVHLIGQPTAEHEEIVEEVVGGVGGTRVQGHAGHAFLEPSEQEQSEIEVAVQLDRCVDETEVPDRDRVAGREGEGPDL